MAVTIADQERTTTAVLTASAGPIPFPFPIFDLANSDSADLIVTVDGVATTAFSVTGTQQSGFNGSALAWTNVQVTLDAPVTGTVVVTGRRAPRRIANYQEGIGIPARDLNLVLNLLTANLREIYDWVRALVAQVATAAASATAAAASATAAALSASNAAASYALTASLLAIALDDGNQEDGAGASIDDGDQP